LDGAWWLDEQCSESDSFWCYHGYGRNL